jgi:Holliday junction resolvasome RuvABC endonuclease subunit
MGDRVVTVTNNTSVLSLGIDPGLRNTGIAGVELLPNGEYRSRGVKVSRTMPNKDKAFSRMRTSADDQRRIREHWHAITASIELLKPHVIGVENYVVYEPTDIGKLKAAAAALCSWAPGLAADPQGMKDALQEDHIFAHLLGLITNLQDAVAKNKSTGIGLGQAAKTIAVYGGVLGAAYTANIPVYVFQPADIKKRFGGKKSASKQDVGVGAERLITGLAEQMQAKVPQKTLKEHAWDANCHAVLAADQYMLHFKDQFQLTA